MGNDQENAASGKENEMSVSADPAVDPTICPVPKVELLETDGEPLESDWHRLEMNLLIDVVTVRQGDRQDYFVGGNMFIYFDEEQARHRNYRGPDFFFVNGGTNNQ